MTGLALVMTAYIWIRRSPCWGELRARDHPFWDGGLLLRLAAISDRRHGRLLPRAIFPNLQEPVFHLLTVANSLRWFFLIVVYGVFIPNTWRRCA